MRKLLLPIVLGAASMAAAADIEVNGSVNFDYATYFDEDFDPTNAANQDIDLSVTAHLDENVAVKVSTNTHSSFGDSAETSEIRRHGYARTTAIDSDGRYTAFNFDGVQLMWTFVPQVTMIFGDLTYNAGGINYYYWRDTGRDAAIVRDQSLRGLGFEFGTEKYGQGKVYMGAADGHNASMAVFASYAAPLLNKTNEHLTITPSVDWMFGQHLSRSYTYTMGVEVDYSKSMGDLNYGAYAAWGVHPYKEVGVHSFLIEPSFNYAFFNLGLSFFYAKINDKYSNDVEPQIFTDDQMLFAVEPSFNLHKKLTLGVGYEYHDKNTNVDDDQYHFLGLNFNIYPTLHTELVIWAGYNFDDNSKTDFAMGISGSANF